MINALFDEQVLEEEEIVLLIEWLGRLGRLPSSPSTPVVRRPKKKVEEALGRLVPVEVILNTIADMYGALSDPCLIPR